MSGTIGSFQQAWRALTKPTGGTTGAPQQGPAGPPQQAGGTSSTKSLFTDSFTASPATPQRNPVIVPEPTTPTITSASTGEKPSVSRTGKLSGSVMIGPGGISGEAKAEAGVKVEGGIFSLEVGGYAQVGSSFSRDTAMTTFSVEAEVGMKAEVGVDTPLVEASVNATGGVRGSYQVTLPTAAAEGITSPEMAAEQLNPSLPQNLPVGATVTLNGEAFSSTGMEVTFKKVAEMFDISAGMSVETANGMSISVTKLDDKTVRVTAGPTEAVSRTLEASIGLFGLTAGVSDSARVEGQLQTRQVDFDISTPQGQAAYNRFLATGELPKNDPANGTSNAASVQIVTGEMSREVQLGISLGNATLESDEYVFTQYDDGHETFQYTGQKGPVTVTIGGDPKDESTYTYQATLDQGAVGYQDGTRQSFPGATGTGDTVTFTFTPDEAAKLQQIAQQRVANYNAQVPGFKDAPEQWVFDMAAAPTPEKGFFELMTPTANNDTGSVMERIGELSTWADPTTGSVVLPGQATFSQQ